MTFKYVCQGLSDNRLYDCYITNLILPYSYFFILIKIKT